MWKQKDYQKVHLHESPVFSNGDGWSKELKCWDQAKTQHADPYDTILCVGLNKRSAD